MGVTGAAKAPRCLHAFRTQGVERPAAGFDGHGAALNSYHLLHCPHCGGGEHAIIGYTAEVEWDGAPTAIFVSPLELACAGCGFKAVFFDSDTDGYNAEACPPSATIRGEGVNGPAACPCGGTRVSSVTCRFEYPDDLDEMDEIASGEFAAENLFSWFTVVATCTACREIRTVADFECA